MGGWVPIISGRATWMVDSGGWVGAHSKWLCALTMATYYGWRTYYGHLLWLAHLLWPLTMASALAASASFSAVPHAASTLAAPSSLANSTVARPTPPAAAVTNNTVSLGLELGLGLGF